MQADADSLQITVARLQQVVNDLQCDRNIMGNRVAAAHDEISRHIAAVAQWEDRFDKLLQVMRGDTSTSDTKWREVIERLHGWMPRKDT